MKNKLFNSVILTTILSSLSWSIFSPPAISTTEQNYNDRFGLELHYFETAYNCGSSGEAVTIDVEVYKNGQLIKTMSEGERFLLNDTDSVSDLTFEYITSHDLSNCPFNAKIEQLLGPQDPIPSLPGAHGQQSLQDLVSNLDSYEQLHLVELGTNDPNYFTYDLQDVILVVDNNPNSAPVAQDDTATVTILNSVTIDVLANDIDPDGDSKSITSIDSVFGGNAVMENNKIIYTAGYVVGEFSLTYTVQDSFGKSDVGTVTIEVTAFAD